MKSQRNFEKIRKIVVKKALEGANITHLARDYMVTRQFIYKWLKRYKKNPTGEWWEERSRIPKNPKRKVTPEIKEQISIARHKLGFNIVKIEVWLKRQGIQVSHTTIQKELQKAGEPTWSVRKKAYKRYKRFERDKPNDLWQIDSKGPAWIDDQGQHVYLLTVIDDHSRFLVISKLYPHPVSQQNILDELDKAFQIYGRPRQILSDNGAQFYGVRGGTSRFTRCMYQEGVQHIRSRINHPQTCGKVERQHGTTFRELVRLNLRFCNADLQHYRDYYNFCRPHQGIDLLTPGERFMNVPPRTIMLKSVTDLS